MIQLLFDITTQTVKLAAPAVLKVGADVAVTITFSADPGEVTGLSLALGTDATTPDVLAFTDDFSEESETVQTAVLDANDSRLIDYMAAKGTTTVKLEVTAVIDGLNVVTPNVDVSVQKAIVDGPEATEGGPTYYTQAEVDALLALRGPFRFSAITTAYIGSALSTLDSLPTTALTVGTIMQFVHATEGLRSYQLTAGTDAEASPGIIRPDDYHASTNAKVWKSI